MANDHDIPVPFQWLAKDAGSALAFQMTHPTGDFVARVIILRSLRSFLRSSWGH